MIDVLLVLLVAGVFGFGCWLAELCARLDQDNKGWSEWEDWL